MTQEINCPKCGGENVYLGIPEAEGTPVPCYDCQEVTFVKRVVNAVYELLGLSAHF